MPMSATPVLAPVPGRAVRMEDVPDPVFAQGMVGPGAAIDPPRGVVEAVAPIAGSVLKVLPHAYVILGADGVGILVHLGIDTVQLDGQGFTVHVEKGAEVTAGQLIVTYDVPAVETLGRNPVVPVIALEKAADDVALSEAVTSGAPLAALDTLFTVAG
jgi:glucose-specific phosphotransferase system IIA component